MKFRKQGLVLLLTLMITFAFLAKVFADDTSEAILRVLIKKGLITQSEVNQMKAQVRGSSSGNLERRVSKLENNQSQTPGWISNLKFKGDLRLRNEYIANDPNRDNNRQRLRFRLGATTKVHDKVDVGFGFATGSSQTPNSTNQTLEREFESKDIWLDYAYAKYKPVEWAKFTGGKFKTPFFHTDMLWDSDIRFDGFAADIHKKININGDIPTTLSLTGGYFPIENENTSTGKDIYLIAIQGKAVSEFNDGYAKLKTGLAYYSFENIAGTNVAGLVYERNTNTKRGANFAYDYQVLSPTVKASFKDFFGLVDVPWGIFGEYAHNFRAPKANEAWRSGFWLGSAKVKKKNQWRFLWQYTRLETDAFLDVFPDADFNGGGTNAQGWEIILDYALTKNVILSLDYYNTESLSSTKADQQIVQADVIFKF